MKNKKLIILYLVLFFSVLYFLLNNYSNKTAPNKPEIDEQLTDTIKTKTSSPPDSTLPISEEIFFEHYKSADHPLQFYGKVIDQDDNPVEGVEVAVRFNQVHDSAAEALATGDWRKYIDLTLTTDTNGIFQLSTRGHYLSVLKFEKEGYTETRGYERYFSYGHPVHGQNRAGIHYPDPQSPVIYHLWRNENSLVISNYFQHNFNSHDGPQVLDVASGRWNRTATGVVFDIEIDPREEGSRQHSWTLKIHIPNGGIIETEASHFFRAPEEGYQPEVFYSFDAGSSNWSRQHSRAFYYIYMENTQNYAGLGLNVITSSKGNAIVSGTIVFNPTGSRNLQPE